MILIVCGGRNYFDERAGFAALDLLHQKRPITLLVHGACSWRGSADWIGEAWAQANAVPFERCPVDHVLDGPWPGAGPRRNRRMRDKYQPDGVMALPGDKGTRDMIRAAREKNIPVWIPYPLTRR